MKLKISKLENQRARVKKLVASEEQSPVTKILQEAESICQVFQRCRDLLLSSPRKQRHLKETETSKVYHFYHGPKEIGSQMNNFDIATESTQTNKQATPKECLKMMESQRKYYGVTETKLQNNYGSVTAEERKGEREKGTGKERSKEKE